MIITTCFWVLDQFSISQLSTLDCYLWKHLDNLPYVSPVDFVCRFNICCCCMYERNIWYLNLCADRSIDATKQVFLWAEAILNTICKNNHLSMMLSIKFLSFLFPVFVLLCVICAHAFLYNNSLFNVLN